MSEQKSSRQFRLKLNSFSSLLKSVRLLKAFDYNDQWNWQIKKNKNCIIPWQVYIVNQKAEATKEGLTKDISKNSKPTEP